MDLNNIASLLGGVTNDKSSPMTGCSTGFGSNWIIWVLVVILLCCCNGSGFGNFGNRDCCDDYVCYCKRKPHKKKRCHDYCDDDCCCDWSFLIILILILCCCCKQQPAYVPVRDTRSSGNIINVDSKEEE